MALYVRQLSDEEKKTLKQSLRCQREEPGFLSGHLKGRKHPQRLGVHAKTARRLIKAFNLKGFCSLSPKPKSGRKRQVADEIIYFLHNMD